MPKELDGLDINPEELENLEGDNSDEKKRVIICYDVKDEEKVAALLGIAKIDKVIYELPELLEE